ncbi:Tyrosine-protein kinase ptk [Fundidesulfovibrio magnetotacticus]|uniref:Tyrosine-protein kinase ptk n=1 Tax=Fundidesulfovibrio magnetotacticus TaxID=2730080 RepID=A0A6V8LTI3_9BACT|nr:XrtA system polysaccharide chain length determinant [Fundidesulfovibrio magnetotacticus]GFK93891.1 Tyrosine-protein kinase ptk [Fundidesulfovibrio magnetotacticus]
MSNSLHEYHYYIGLILGRKRLLLAVAAIVMTAGVIVAYSLPKTYEASSTVFLEQNVITDLVKGIAVTPSVDAKLKMLSVALLSRTMMLKVITELNKDMAYAHERHVEEYLQQLTSRTKISFQEKQGVFRITLRDVNPVFAKDFVNTITRKYIDENTSSKREESLDATKFLAEQIEIFKRRIDTAEDAISRYKSEKGYLLSTDDIFLRGEIATGEKKLEEIAIKRAELEAKLRIIKERGPEPGKLAEAEAHLSDMLARYTEEHPKVARARAEVARLRYGRGDEAGRRSSLAAQDAVHMLEIEIEALKSMQEHQQKLLADNKNNLREMPSVKAELAELVRKKENESVVYQQLVSRYGQSEVSKQMELQDKSITFRILDPAVLPQNPVSPNRLLIILASMGGGIVAGAGLIILMDLIRGGVKGVSELKELAIPVLAVVPNVQDMEAERVVRRKDRLIMTLAAGYFALILVLAVSDTMHLGARSEVITNYLVASVNKFISN